MKKAIFIMVMAMTSFSCHIHYHLGTPTPTVDTIDQEPQIPQSTQVTPSIAIDKGIDPAAIVGSIVVEKKGEYFCITDKYNEDAFLTKEEFLSILQAYLDSFKKDSSIRELQTL